jgi:hypothetical protein
MRLAMLLPFRPCGFFTLAESLPMSVLASEFVPTPPTSSMPQLPTARRAC